MSGVAVEQIAIGSGMALYMLNWGESYERQNAGPYIGKSDLDFRALGKTYHSEAHAAAEEKGDDYCSTGELEFAGWLVVKGYLSHAPAQDIEIEIPTANEAPYMPKHWPECPICREGRGDKEYGDARRGLNRQVTFRRCVLCRHEWGHDEEPYHSGRPMLEDDGRDTMGGCVPFSIGKACGLNFQEVLAVCKKHGWSSHDGMYQRDAVVAAAEMGFELMQRHEHGIGTKSSPTIKQLLPCLHDDRNYILGVRGHWLSVVAGRVTDNVAESSMARRVIELYEVRRISGGSTMGANSHERSAA